MEDKIPCKMMMMMMMMISDGDEIPCEVMMISDGGKKLLVR